MTNQHLAGASAALLILVAGPFQASAQEGTGIEEQVRQVADEWMAAANSEDLESFMDVMAEDAIVMFPGMDPVVGSDAIRAVYGDYYATWDLEYDYNLHEVVDAGRMLIATATVSGPQGQVGRRDDRPSVQQPLGAPAERRRGVEILAGYLQRWNSPVGLTGHGRSRISRFCYARIRLSRIL